MGIYTGGVRTISSIFITGAREACLQGIGIRFMRNWMTGRLSPQLLDYDKLFNFCIMNKKHILVISFVGFTMFLLGIFISLKGYCLEYTLFCSRAHDDSLAATLLVFTPLLLLSIITYKMRNEVYDTWIKFAYVWVPLTIILTILSPEYSLSLLPITKGVVSFFMSASFLVISLIMIIYRFVSIRHQG